jgi:23S rRNA (guanine745-N1)-methyltransferase
LTPPPTLLCTVRSCHLRLEREERRVVCARGHSFDIARSGYINLLQPQDRRSPNPGDSAGAVIARRRFFDRGFDAPIVDAIIGMMPLAAGDDVLDAGCGEGHHLAAIVERFHAHGHGLDISLPAIDAAARRYRRAEWVVANADRFVPYADASFAAVVTITSRMNAAEFRRVVRDGGSLLVVIPAPDDLIELREAILAEGVQRDRSERTISTFAPLFMLDRTERIRAVAHLDHAAIGDVLTSSYRGLRSSERERLEAIGDADVTLSRDALLFRPRIT